MATESEGYMFDDPTPVTINITKGQLHALSFVMTHPGVDRLEQAASDQLPGFKYALLGVLVTLARKHLDVDVVADEAESRDELAQLVAFIDQEKAREDNSGKTEDL
jgi:hypothetical protein